MKFLIWFCYFFPLFQSCFTEFLPECDKEQIQESVNRIIEQNKRRIARIWFSSDLKEESV